MRILMMGTGEFAEPTFQALLDSRHDIVGLVTNPDRPKGKNREMTRHIKQVALERNVPVFQPQSVNSPEGIAGVASFRPELLVVAAYGQILSKELLGIPPHGGINVHASLLPKYRGAAPINWAIYHGESETGVTIIKMSPRMDAGDMLAQEKVAIQPEETAGQLEERLAPLGAGLALRVIAQIEAGTVQGVKQDLSQVTNAPKLKKEHGLIDWTRTANQVCNQIRAMQPWPTAYTHLHQEARPPLRMIVHQATVKSQAASAGKPGVVAETTSESVCVQTAAGIVALLAVQPSGKRVMTITEFLRGRHVAVGEVFA